MSNTIGWPTVNTTGTAASGTLLESRHLTSTQRARIVKRLDMISHLFDEAIRIPGTNIRLGWDGIIGVVPVVGDALTTLMSAYFMWEANRLGVRKRTLVKMLGNVLVDFAVGLVPVLGDIADIAWKANRRNMRLLRKELAR